MKVKDILEGKLRSGRYPQQLTATFEDPKTGEEKTVELSAIMNYDDGDIGFGVGFGKSPYQPQWDVDSVTVITPFVLNGKQYREGDLVDTDELAPYSIYGEDWVTKELEAEDKNY